MLGECVFRLRASGVSFRTSIADSATRLGLALLRLGRLRMLCHNMRRVDGEAEVYNAYNHIAGAHQLVTLPPVGALQQDLACWHAEKRQKLVITRYFTETGLSPNRQKIIPVLRGIL